MKKVHLGLDLGIASVGWSLVDENQNIIATGSHLFPKLSDPQNNSKYGEGTRGHLRRTRRILNRRKQRKIDFLNMIDLWNDNHQLKIKELKDKGKDQISKLYKKNINQFLDLKKKILQQIFYFTKQKNLIFIKFEKKDCVKK